MPRSAPKRTSSAALERSRAAEDRRRLRVLSEREQDFEERYQGPADVEGIAGRPSLLVLRDKNMTELRRAVVDLPNIPFLYQHDDEGRPIPGTAIGYDRAVRYVQTEVAKLVDAIGVVGPYNVQQVKDRFALRSWLTHRAGFLILPGPIGERMRADFLRLVEEILYAPAIPHLVATSNETEVVPTEAPRRGYG